MIKIQEKPIETNIVKKVNSELDMYKLYFNQLSVLGLNITKVQVNILSTICLNFSEDVINLEKKKQITKQVSTTLQVVENTLVKFRKKGIVTKDNFLDKRFKIKLNKDHKFTVLYINNERN
jgi:Fe2+ or Zn2+ uptake regulation protein